MSIKDHVRKELQEKGSTRLLDMIKEVMTEEIHNQIESHKIDPKIWREDDIYYLIFQRNIVAFAAKELTDLQVGYSNNVPLEKLAAAITAYQR